MLAAIINATMTAFTHKSNSCTKHAKHSKAASNNQDCRLMRASRGWPPIQLTEKERRAAQRNYAARHPAGHAIVAGNGVQATVLVLVRQLAGLRLLLCRRGIA